ncbi:MAG: 1-acyl-sn-glycerol-3-phosphate acyltransferase [Microscillaceae bacterium]|nr:1-acyl-sn-glycerol-3-phosphate acyltransferase [Microscillaceae bacterium]MDW8461194.1 lysophospholipid acyltransferase family protein [Cytophagales bacterium]
MKTVFNWITTLIYLPFFLFYLLIYELFARISFLLSFQLYSWVIKSMQYLVIYTLYVTGFRIKFNLQSLALLPQDTPVVIVSNHQSMFDIPCIILAFHKFHVNFVAKKELGKNIPTVSFHLRNGGSVLIDRKDSESAIQQIARLGKHIEARKEAACIYPEGTRSRNGILKEFKKGGFITLMENAPSAWVVPVIIKNTYKIVQYGMLPIPTGIKVKVSTLLPLQRENFESLATMLTEIENQIKEILNPVPRML